MVHIKYAISKPQNTGLGSESCGGAYRTFSFLYISFYGIRHSMSSRVKPQAHGSHASNSQHTTRSTVPPTYTCNLHYARIGLELILLRAHTHTRLHMQAKVNDPNMYRCLQCTPPPQGLRSACTSICVIGRRHGRILVAQTAVWFEGLLTSWVLGDAE